MNYITDRATDHTTDCIITTEQLTKKYKNFTSVNNVSLHIRKGSIYGFLGPNGAGKSTTMKMLLGLTKPTAGSFTIDGKHFPADRLAILKEIGSFIESPSFYSNLTGRENLDIIRRILKLPKSTVDEALELVGLTEFGDRLAKKYSLGMKQRLGLAGALLGRPPILILDEPTAGLDPKERIRIRNLISDLSGDKIVLIATHVVSDIEFISKEILLMKNGRVVDKDCPEALQKKIAGKVFEIRIVQEELNQVKKEFEISNLFRTEGEIVVRVISEECPTAYRWTEVSPTLEDVYLYEFECTSKED